jgi:hypothetical protein
MRFNTRPRSQLSHSPNSRPCTELTTSTGSKTRPCTGPASLSRVPRNHRRPLLTCTSPGHYRCTGKNAGPAGPPCESRRGTVLSRRGRAPAEARAPGGRKRPHEPAGAAHPRSPPAPPHQGRAPPPLAAEAPRVWKMPQPPPARQATKRPSPRPPVLLPQSLHGSPRAPRSQPARATPAHPRPSVPGWDPVRPAVPITLGRSGAARGAWPSRGGRGRGLASTACGGKLAPPPLPSGFRCTLLRWVSPAQRGMHVLRGRRTLFKARPEEPPNSSPGSRAARRPRPAPAAWTRAVSRPLAARRRARPSPSSLSLHSCSAPHER